MDTTSVTFTFFLIFSGAAVLASLALYTRQPLLIAYIALGALLGPYGIGLTTDVELLRDFAHVGIIFLLFLLGLDMQPRALLTTLRKSTLVTLLSAATFALTGGGVALLLDFDLREAIVVGLAMMFSSTIIGIKLLPTTVLHHRHTGELMIGVLLLQDILAILVLVLLTGGAGGRFDINTALLSLLALPVLVAGAALLVRVLMVP
jgi:Kef-type K+ transport system membrane component KefB